MLSRVRDFLTRHRRKFIVTGIVVGGTYLALRYAQRRLMEFQERQARDFIEKSRRLQHFECTERTCNQVIFGMGAELCEEILRECTTNDLLQQLRQNPTNKLELWEEIKIVAFTRLSVLIYASSMLVVALRVQLNLLGGYLYNEIITDKKQITEELKQQYLSLISHFIHDGGLQQLINLIRSKVVIQVKSLPLSKQFTLTDLEQLFWSLQLSINSDNDDPNLYMSRYLLPSKTNDIIHGGPLLEKMYNETLDLLDSDDATSICASNINRGFSLACDAIAENLGETVLIAQDNLKTTEQTNNIARKLTSSTIGDGKKNVLNNNSMININNIEIALAKVIPIVSGITSKGYDGNTRPQNLATSMITFFAVSEKCKMLGANVYETFCSS